MAWALGAVLMLLLALLGSQVNADIGSASEQQDGIVLHPDANVFIGAVLALRSRGAGLFGCGQRTVEGNATLQALRWITKSLHGEESGPFVPKGVNLGVRVLDFCGRPRVAVSQLAELVPDLRQGQVFSSPADSLQSLRTVGILDGAGLARTDSDADLEVRHTLAEAMIPVAPVDNGNLVQPTQRAQAILALMRKLQWHRFVVVRGSDAYSTQLWQALVQLAGSQKPAHFCVDSLENFPTSMHEVVSDESLIQEVMEVVTDAAVSGVPVLVLMPRAAIKFFLVALRETGMPPAAPAALMMFLSDLIAPEHVALLPAGATVYSLATSRDGVPIFQSFLNDTRAELCEDDCEDDMNGALQTDVMLTVAQPVLMFALALKRSWESKCLGNTSKECPPWTAMSRPEFLSTYFAPISAAIGRGESISEHGWPSDWTGLLRPPTHLTLYKYLTTETQIVRLKKVLRTSTSNSSNSDLVDVEVLDKSFKPEPVGVCATRPESSDCERTCLPLGPKHSRTTSGRRMESWTNFFDDDNDDIASNGDLDTSVNHLLQSHSQRSSDFLRLLESPQNVYLTLFLSLHRSAGSAGESVLQCPEDSGSKVDAAAVRRLEAFLWALQRVNAQLARDGVQLQLGALLADTCSSQLRAMTLAAQLRMQDNKLALGHGETVLAVINALSMPDAKLAADILSERNISSISTMQVVDSNDLAPFQLQVDLPLLSIVQSMVETLSQLGWTYVTVVNSDPSAKSYSDLARGSRLFLEAATRAGICVSLELTLPDDDTDEEVVSQLMGSRASGARGVVVWAESSSVRKLFKSVGKAIGQGTLRRDDLFWLLASPHADGRDLLQEFGNVIGGAAVFTPQRRGVLDFQHYLREESSRGVTGSERERDWLRQYDQQCADGECPTDGDWTVIQAVFAAGAAAAKLMQFVCEDQHWKQGGKVCFHDEKSRPMQLQAAIHKALRDTRSPRADGPAGAEFYFAKSGAGAVAVDVENFRRKPGMSGGVRGRSLGDLHFQKVGVYATGKLNSLGDLVTYRDSGDEVKVNSLTSQCSGTFGSCHRCRVVRGRPNSALGQWIKIEPAVNKDASVEKPNEATLYVIATLDVHEPSNNPLQCGQEISRTGIEQLEAFLWAVDQFNSNYTGLKLGAIVVDTCGSAPRTSRLISDLLADRDDEEPVIAVVAGGPTGVSAPAVEAAGALGLPAIAPSARGPSPDRKTHPPYPLQLAPSNSAVASAVKTLMRKLDWKCLSVIYLQDAVDYEESFRQLNDIFNQEKDLSLRAVVALPTSVDQGGVRTRIALSKVSENLGDHGMVLMLLPRSRVDQIMRTAAALEDEGLWKPEKVTWISLSAEDVLLAHSRQTFGSLVLRPRVGRVPEFERYFQTLNVETNPRNPWFPEFWSRVFHCRGSGCRSGLHHNLHAYQLHESPDTPNIINSVLALGHALQTVRRELCPEAGSSSSPRGPCRSMTDLPRVRARLLEVSPRMAFVGAGLNNVAFSLAGQNTNVGVQVFNIQLLDKGDTPTTVHVGDVSASGTVTGLNKNSIRVYLGPNRAPRDMNDVKDACMTNNNSTTSSSPPAEKASQEDLMEIRGSAQKGVAAPTLLVLMAAHEQGDGPFRCGELSPDALCQLAGVMFAVHRVNHNSSLLQTSGVHLGLTAIDTCAQPGRAYSSVYSYLSSLDYSRFAPAAALVLDTDAPRMVGPLLEMQTLAQLRDPSAAEDQESLEHVTVQASVESLSKALLDVAEVLQAPALVVIHGSSARSRSLARQLESTSLSRCPGGTGAACLSAVLPVPLATNSAANSRPGPQYLLASQVAGTVVILATDRPEETQAVLVAAQSPLVPRLVFLTAPSSRSHAASLRSDGHSILSVVADASVVRAAESPRGPSPLDTAFQQWLTDLRAPQGMPLSWVAGIRNADCALNERRQVEDDQWTLEDIVSAVDVMGKALTRAIVNSTNFNNISSPANLSSLVSTYLEAGKESDLQMDPPEEVASFSLWRGRESLGSWSPLSGLVLSTEPNLLTLDELVASGRPTVFHNFQHVWGLALGVIALLGILSTLLTAVFFLTAAAVSKTPISGGAGTSCLGWCILGALILLHSAVLCLVLAPTEMTCAARRLLPATAYAIIFSAMFLKVLTTWKVCDRKGGVMGPVALVWRALALAAPQVLVSAGWLVLIPPAVHVVSPTDPQSSPLWQCYPPLAGDRNAHFLLSLSYTCLLMVATSVLALLCSSKEELLEEGTMLRQESRCVLISALSVAVELGCWGLSIVASPPAPQHSDFLAASVHALAAATLLLCLFLPKLRLYLRIRRDAKNTAAIAASAASRSSQPIYGISHFEPFSGKLNPAFAAPSMDMSLGESASQSGSVTGSQLGSEGDYNDPTQVIPSSLYSIDMFSSQDNSPGMPAISEITPVPVLLTLSPDGRGTVRANHAALRAVHGTLRGAPAIAGQIGGTIRSVRSALRVSGGTIRGSGSALRTPYCLTGANEFTAPHRSSSLLLLPGHHQESISYM